MFLRYISYLNSRTSTLRWIAIVACVVIASGPNETHARTNQTRQSCEGTISYDADGMLLLIDIVKNASSWCDAYIGEKDDPQTKQVLASCPLGSRCEIDGYYAGHGSFYWTQIFSARLKSSDERGTLTAFPPSASSAAVKIRSESEELNACVAEGSVPGEITECLKDAAKRDGALLEQEYKDLLARSPRSNIENLRSNERAWLKAQRLQCETARQAGAREGSGYDKLNYARCDLRTTIDRIGELKSMMLSK